MARKAWKDLSPKYRQGLIRRGITEKQHAAGKALPRTKKYSQVQQSAYERTRSRYDEYVAIRYRTMSDEQKQAVRDALANARPDRAIVWMDYQMKMTKAYELGGEKAAQKLYDKRPHDMPKEMSFYHGAFS